MTNLSESKIVVMRDQDGKLRRQRLAACRVCGEVAPVGQVPPVGVYDIVGEKSQFVVEHDTEKLWAGNICWCCAMERSREARGT